MTPFLQLALAMAILITAAKTGGYVSYRLGQPSVLGELIVGIILGPSLIDILHLPYFTNENLPELIHIFAELGVMLLMFLAGLELHLSDLVKSSKISALSGSLGVILPFLLGTGLVFIFPIPLQEALFLGLILSATSVSISAQTLMELQVLRSRVGISLLGAAVFDDILVILGLSVFTALALSEGGGNYSQVLIILLKMILYLSVASGIGLLIIPKLSRLITNLPISQGLVAFTIVSMLIYGWGAEYFGNMAAITGAFLAGLLFSRSPSREPIEHGMASLAYGLFVPIFFIDVGLKANIRELAGPSFWLFLVMTVIAILGKVIGSGLGGIIGGLNRKQALQIGIGMMSRGEVGLIVAALGIAQGFIDERLYSAVVGVVILTTLLTPPLLRATFQEVAEPKTEERGNSDQQENSNTDIRLTKGDGQ
jgi:Na+:H+ antiporter